MSRVNWYLATLMGNNAAGRGIDLPRVSISLREFWNLARRRRRRQSANPKTHGRVRCFSFSL